MIPYTVPNETTGVEGKGTTSNPLTIPNLKTNLTWVFVVLWNDTKLSIPISPYTTVQELHAQALQRAQRHGVTGSMEDTTLFTAGRMNLAAQRRFLVVNILSSTIENSFFLGEPDTLDYLASPRYGLGDPITQASETTNVYIRWITVEAALNTSRLSNLPVDEFSIPEATSLEELHQVAKLRFCPVPTDFSSVRTTNLNLFLAECKLYAEDNPATLKDLGLKGSKSAPLDIFVEHIGPEPRTLLDQLISDSHNIDPKSVWSFNSTKRGISTFVTSLQILFKEIEQDRCNLDGILEVLLELTHFPPVLLAFKAVYDSGLDQMTPAGPLLLIAAVIQALCRRMVPTKICPSQDSCLQASRQVLCWIYTLCSHGSVSRGYEISLVHRVQVVPTDHFIPAFFPFKEVFMRPYSPDTRGRSFQVSLEDDDDRLCQRVGLALHEKAVIPWDSYFKPEKSWEMVLEHKLRRLLSANEFESLIDTTNIIIAFKMVEPLQIDSRLTTELPVITLSKNGYVSRYDHEDLECSERSFITWNAIEGRSQLPDNAGQFLSKKLDPLLQKRRQTRYWELDSWPEWSTTATFGAPDEAIVVCVDTSNSMSQSMQEGWIPGQSSKGSNMSRLSEVKEFFKNLAIRISALNLSTHLGLVTFSHPTEVKTVQKLTPLALNFSRQLDKVQVGGYTAIFNALKHSHDMLSTIQKRYPKTKCRIILLTDGEDNHSDQAPQDVCRLLYNSDIVLDSVVIDSCFHSSYSSLFKISGSTGGYAFAPTTQQSLFQIFLLETMVDIRSRPDIVKKDYVDWDTFPVKKPEMLSPFDFPPCRPHANLDDHFIALADAELFMSKMSKTSDGSSSISTRFSRASTVAGVGGLSRILLGEIKAMIENPHQYMDVYVSQSNMNFWKVVMQGPPESTYSKGTFLLYIDIGSEFPRKPPSARFITPMLHPNITKHGRICHPIFSREWSPATRVYQVLQQVYGILMALEARDAVDPLAALKFWCDKASGNKQVMEYVKQFALRSREWHRADIIDDDQSTVASSSKGSSYTNQTQDPFANPPPSYRSGLSSSGTSVRSSFTISTLLSHLASQRRRPAPPPLLDCPTQDDMSGGVATAGGKTVSRRARFFGNLRNVSSEIKSELPTPLKKHLEKKGF
ncbi:hypothetical protein BJ875DRAFT_395206 [Amylocarpus encephaloides]|uniref:UBC core domain-containing protein n=1 Tax=Amylocarpus encephaloides TaxID=45428 RepID=A0A9P7YQV7_9HELO|nr:hypothetical protein BJ875DRAFT_395206 [Amylocarpus encephaloides]